MSALFDLSFRRFIAPTIAKVIYILIMIGIGLVYLGFVASAFARSAGAGVFVLLILGPVAAFIYLVLARVFLEGLLAQIRTAENTSEMLSIMRAQGGGALAAPGTSWPSPQPSQPTYPSQPGYPGQASPADQPAQATQPLPPMPPSQPEPPYRPTSGPPA